MKVTITDKGRADRALAVAHNDAGAVGLHGKPIGNEHYENALMLAAALRGELRALAEPLGAGRELEAAMDSIEIALMWAQRIAETVERDGGLSTP